MSSPARAQTFPTRIAPWLTVGDASQAVAYYRDAFSAGELYRLEGEDGKLEVAQLSVLGADFWIQADPDASPRSGGAGAIRMVLSVEDPDAVFQRAVQAGATVIYPVTDAHGWRTGRVIDPFGHDWEIGRQLARE